MYVATSSQCLIKMLSIEVTSLASRFEPRCEIAPGLSATRRLAHKFNRTGVNDWSRAQFSAEQRLRNTVLLGLRGLQKEGTVLAA